MDRWPIPFSAPEQARQFFASEGLEPDPWIAGLERRADGLWPAFDKTVLIDSIAELAARDYWAEWDTIRCPTLIVRGERGDFSAARIEQLAQRLPNAEAATIRNAGHDLHLEDPAEWLLVLQRFLARQQHS